MTKEEVKKLLKIISYSYPNWKPSDLGALVETWEMMLSDENYNELSLGLKSYIKTDKTGFAPTIGQLIQHSKSIQGINIQLNEAEAWGYVSKAIARSTYYAEEEFLKLPPMVKKAVGNPRTLREYAALPVDQVNTVEKSLFQRTFRDVVKRINEINSLPIDVKQLTGNTVENYLGITGNQMQVIETKQAIDEETEEKPISWERLQALYNELKGEGK